MNHKIIPMNSKEQSYGYLFIFLQLLVIPLFAPIICDLFSIPSTNATLNLICYLINFLCVSIIFRNFLCQSLKLFFKRPLSALLCAGGFLAIYYASTILLNLIIFSLEPDFSNANDAAITNMARENFIPMSVSLVLLVPLVEEVLYRGLIFGHLHQRYPVLSFFVSSVCFALIHVAGYINTVSPYRLFLCFLQYIPAGLCLAGAYKHNGNIFTSILIHSIINFIGVASM